MPVATSWVRDRTADAEKTCLRQRGRRADEVVGVSASRRHDRGTVAVHATEFPDDAPCLAARAVCPRHSVVVRQPNRISSSPLAPTAVDRAGPRPALPGPGRAVHAVADEFDDKPAHGRVRLDPGLIRQGIALFGYYRRLQNARCCCAPTCKRTTC